MKDTFGFPRTLRNYPEQHPKPNTFVSPLQQNKSYKSLSSYNGKKTVEQQEHNVGEGDYYVLTNPSQIKSKENKPKKNKKKNHSKESHLSQALRQQLNKPIISYSQIGPQNILHCRSLEKLQIISNDRSEEIKALMNEKGFLMAQNEDLRAKLANPSYREQDYIQKIAQRQFEIQNMKQNLKRKEQIIVEIEKDYKLQIERLRVKHREEMAALREKMNNLRLEKMSQSPKKYTSTYVSSNQRTQKPQTVYNSYKPVIETKQKSYNPVIQTKVSNPFTSHNYKFNSQTQSSSSPVVVHSLNYSSNYKPSASNNLASKSPERVQTENSKQTFKTYIGEDGYERRVYTQLNSESPDHGRKSTTINEHRNSLESQGNSQTIKYPSPISTNQYQQSTSANQYQSTGANQYQSTGANQYQSTSANQYQSISANQYQSNPFTNDKLTTYVSKETPASTNIYKYSESSYGKQAQEQKSVQQDYPQHNQNLYSNSLTFQCFNDFN